MMRVVLASALLATAGIASAEVAPLAAPPSGPLVRSTSFELLPGYLGAPFTSVPELAGVTFDGFFVDDLAVLGSSCGCYLGRAAQSGEGAALTFGAATVELTVPVNAASVYVSASFIGVSVPSTITATMSAYDAAGGLLGEVSVPYVGSVASCADVPANPRQLLGLSSTTPIARLVISGFSTLLLDDLTLSPVAAMPPGSAPTNRASAIATPPSGPAVTTASFEGLPDFQTGVSISHYHGMKLSDFIIVDPADLYTDCGIVPAGGAHSGTTAAYTNGRATVELAVPSSAVGMWVAQQSVSVNASVPDGIALLQAYDGGGNLIGQVPVLVPSSAPSCESLPAAAQRFVGLQAEAPVSSLLLQPLCSSNLYVDDLVVQKPTGR